jgi:large subunit ribosomal protein L4
VVRLPGEVFNVPVRLDLLHRTVRWLRSVWQQGTHKAKSRGEVRGGGRKPRPQKGTGASRQGSIRSPIWVGGGVAHGPIPRSHAHKLPLPVQLAAYKCALSAKANEGRLVVVENLVPPARLGPDGQLRVRTKPTADTLKMLLEGVPGRTVLLVDSGEDAADGGVALRQGARNLPWVCILPWQRLTVYHLMKYNALVITQPALAAVVARLRVPPTTDGVELRRAAWRVEHEAAYAHASAQLLEGQAALRNAALLAGPS